MMIILIPMPVFLQSRLALKKKLILVGVFALGGFTVSRDPAVTTAGILLANAILATDSVLDPQQILQFQRAVWVCVDLLVHS
jgi:hypothetical protein